MNFSPQPALASQSGILPLASSMSGKIFLDVCSGSSRPLSMAVLKQNMSVLSFDVVLDSRMDLLANEAYEDLLRLSSSGTIGYGAARPSSNEYSRVKIKYDGGFRAIRTPEFLHGIRNLTADEALRIQTSFTMLSRCVEILTLVYQTGGHVHLEQPSNAMSWLEPIVRQFLVAISATCVCVPACFYGWDVDEAWLFASSLVPLQTLGGACTHPAGTHPSTQGCKDACGSSQTTACYPEGLALKFAEAVASLLSGSLGDVPWAQRFELYAVKEFTDFPISQEDGGGLHSQPDWSRPDRIEHDHFHDLRQTWLQRIIQQRLDKILLAHVGSENPQPPFSSEQLHPFVEDLENFLRARSITPNWVVREHQIISRCICTSWRPCTASCKIQMRPCFLPW